MRDRILEYLLKAFVEDYFTGRMDIDKAGWRYWAGLNVNMSIVAIRQCLGVLFKEGWVVTHPDEAQQEKKDRVRINLNWIVLDMEDKL